MFYSSPCLLYTSAGKPVIGYLKQNAFEDDSLTMEQEVRKAFSELLAMKAEMERLRCV